ncbi:MAG: tetratricopeptide repeat protein, partial [Anaerolineales bacterium]|nr:tetratricopeptide repeat protein [Anaerolineales bacterium]
RGAIFSVLGEAGLGKTRLVDDFQVALTTAAGGPIRQAEGRCLSYTESVSYAPFQELMRQLIGAPTDADEAALWARLRATAEALAPAEAASHLPYLANFLNLHLDAEGQARVRYLDAEALQRRTFAAIAALAEALTEAPDGPRPLLLILEDIHWIDQASRALLEYLFGVAARVPLGLLLVYRPERTKACWQIREKAVRELPALTGEVELRPLPEGDAHSLLGHLAPGAQWPAELHQLILTQTEGNPLYLEELLRVLIEAGVLVRGLGPEAGWQVQGSLDSVQVPDTLEGVMMTRLDRLDEPSRNTAQVASVIGRTFASGVLKHVTDGRDDAELLPHLFQLQEHEIAAETQRAPERAYTFIHGMMQDVAYGSLLARVRRQVHRRIAEYLENRSSTDEGLYPMLARHAFLGQDWPRALRYQRLAGQQAQRLFANNEALDHFAKALQCAEALPADDTRADRLAIQLALGELHTVTARYDRAGEHLAEALRLAGEAGDPAAEARACRWQARVNELRGDYPAAFEWIDRGRAALARVPGGEETAEAAELALIRGLIHVRQGAYEPAAERARAARRIAAAVGDPRALGRAENLLGVTELRDNARAAIEHFQRALDLYQQAGDLQGQANTSNLMANAHFKLGQWSAAAEAYRGARASFSQLGDVYRSALALNNLAGVARNQGHLAEALDHYREAAATLERISASAAVRGIVEMNLGDTHLRQPDVETAFGHLHLAQKLFAQTGSRDFLPELHRHLARAALLSGDMAQAEADCQTALALAEELNMRGERACALRVLGEVDLSRGRGREAERALAESVALLAEAADDYELARSRFAWGRALIRLGRPAQALVQLAEASAVFQRLEADVDWRAAEALRVLLETPELGRPPERPYDLIP